MSTFNDIPAHIEKHEGLLSIKIALQEGFTKSDLDQYIETSSLKRLSLAVYLTPEAAADEMFYIRHFSNNAIFSHETALYLNHLADRDILKWVVTAPTGFGAIPLKTMGVKVYFMKASHYKIGLIESQTPLGRMIYTYNAERTLCDILKANNEIDLPIIEEAFKRYAARQDRDFPKLVEYARQFRIEGLLKGYSHLFG